MVAALSGHCWHVDREVFVPYQDTVGTWIARSLSVSGCSGTSATGMMTPFQILSSSGGGGISIQGQALQRHSTLVGRQVTTSAVTRCPV
jgi:hypothetical protein